MRVQVLGLAGAEVAPSVLVTTERDGVIQPLYLFNAPEGLSRAALEHKLLRPSRGRIAAVFLSGLDPSECCGLPGLVLRGRTDGADASFVFGPPGTVAWAHALRHVMRWVHPVLYAVEWGCCGCGAPPVVAAAAAAAEAAPPAPCCHGVRRPSGHTVDFLYADCHLRVHALGWAPPPGEVGAGAAASCGSAVGDASAAADGDLSVIFNGDGTRDGQRGSSSNGNGSDDGNGESSNSGSGSSSSSSSNSDSDSESDASGWASHVAALPDRPAITADPLRRTSHVSCGEFNAVSSAGADGSSSSTGAPADVARPSKRARRHPPPKAGNSLFAKAPLESAGCAGGSQHTVGLAHVCVAADGASVVVIATCRGEGNFDALRSHPDLARLTGACGGGGASGGGGGSASGGGGKRPSLFVVHFGPPSVLDSPAYAEWKASLGESATHLNGVVGCGADVFCALPPSDDSHRAATEQTDSDDASQAARDEPASASTPASAPAVGGVCDSPLSAPALDDPRQVLHCAAAAQSAANHRAHTGVFPRPTARSLEVTRESVDVPSCAAAEAPTTTPVRPLAVFAFDGRQLTSGLDGDAAITQGDGDDGNSDGDTGDGVLQLPSWVDGGGPGWRSDDAGAAAAAPAERDNRDAADRLRRELMGEDDDGDDGDVVDGAAAAAAASASDGEATVGSSSVERDAGQAGGAVDSAAAAAKGDKAARRDGAPTVTFLGTGCAEPSKHRASSAILVCVPPRGNLLLDAGEGTVGRFVSTLGVRAACDAVTALRCVWISHHHPDHCAGLLGLLSLRARLLSAPSPLSPPPSSHPPPLLAVVGPRTVVRWVTEAAAAAGIDPDSFTGCHFSEFAPGRGGAWPASGLPVAAAAAATTTTHDRVAAELGLASLTSVPVDHCHDAHAAVVTSADGWRLVYSGDTRPCPRLARDAGAPTLLVHEATFNPDVAHQAVAKRHCTTAEALSVAAAMGATRVVLTHFSQRTRRVALPPGCEGSVVCAQDGMRVTLAP